MLISDIETFFQTSSREENDATNKIRENILQILTNPPNEYFEHAKFGPMWQTVHQEWHKALQKVADETGVPIYTHTKIQSKGGRRSKYDADVVYFDKEKQVASRKIEFKNGGTNIGSLPQFLSLQAKFRIFSETYDVYWYKNYLDKYIATDVGITECKPTLDHYKKLVTKTTYSCHPFFAQLKQREEFQTAEKHRIVNESITEYLTKCGFTIDIPTISEKIKTTQTGKIYLLWSNTEKQFAVDKLSENEMTNLSVKGIKNGNVV